MVTRGERCEGSAKNRWRRLSYKVPVKKYQDTRMLCAAQGIETIFDNIFLWILFYKNIELMCYLPETNIILQVTCTSGKNCLILKISQYYCFWSLGGHDRNYREYKKEWVRWWWGWVEGNTIKCLIWDVNFPQIGGSFPPDRYSFFKSINWITGWCLHLQLPHTLLLIPTLHLVSWTQSSTLVRWRSKWIKVFCGAKCF